MPTQMVRYQVAEEARDLQSTVAKWVVGDAPRPQPLELLGSYGVQRREE